MTGTADVGAYAILPAIAPTGRPLRQPVYVTSRAISTLSR